MPHVETFSDVQAGRPIIYYAIRGNLLNDPTQAGVWGVSKMLEWDAPGIGVDDGSGSPYNDGQTVKIKIESMQNSQVAVERAILLAGAIQTVIVQFGLDFYNFVDPYDLGMEVTLDADGSSIILTIEYSGRVLKTQWDTILAAATGATLGVTGGVSITSLTAQAFDDAEYKGSGIIGVFIGTGVLATDDELGLKENGGSKFQMKIAKLGDTTTYLKPVTKKVEFNNTIALFENRATTLARMQAYTNTEQVITWLFGNGLAVVLDKCTKIIQGPKVTDALGLVQAINKGGTFLDPVNGTPTNVTFGGTLTYGGVTYTKITFHKQGAVL